MALIDKEIYVVMCVSDGEPVIAFTSKIDACNYAAELGSTGHYRLEVIEVDLREDGY